MDEPIHVTCYRCQHVLKAPREAAGKHGKCPHCQCTLYIPTPVDELEEIPLAPTDEDPVQTKSAEQEMREFQAELLREREEPASSKKSSAPPPSKPAAASGVNINQAIMAYLTAMKSSQLQKADQIAHQLHAVREQASNRIQQLLVDAMKPDELRDLPDGIYHGFLRKLLEQLKSEE